MLQLGSRVKTAETQNTPSLAQSAPRGRIFSELPRVENDHPVKVKCKQLASSLLLS